MRPTRLRGARTHNLRGLDLDLDPGTLVAVAGPSGAGKSSLAFGTLYAEGQRRYVESFSAYARQFLERLARPPVDELEPVPVGIAVDRQAPVKTSRSTVGTMTEIADYTKVLWAKAAMLECPGCGRAVQRDAPDPAADEVLHEAPDDKVVVTYPVGVRDADHFVGVREALVSDGWRRVWRQGRAVDLDEVRPSDVLGDDAVSQASAKAASSPGKRRTSKGGKKGRRKSKRGDDSPSTPPEPVAYLDVVADRTVARPNDRARLVEALEASMRRGNGRADVWAREHGMFRFSRQLYCPHCERRFREPTPGLFSFNSPLGACDNCRGFGRVIGIDWNRVIPDRDLSLSEGAVRAWKGESHEWERRQLHKHARRAGVRLDVPVRELSSAQWDWLIEGDERGWPNGWFGVRPWFRWMESRSYKMHVRVFLSRYRSYEICDACRGTRLKPEASWWKLGGTTLPELNAMPVSGALAHLEAQEPDVEHDPAVSMLLGECTRRLRALVDVGLGYLSLDRQSRTLSGGEAQRVSLTSALGASLTGAMFVLDEPTVGLHPRDVGRLTRVVRELVRDDNLALVVEHDAQVLRSADRVVELGPGAGEHGGRKVADGTPAQLARQRTATGRALSASAVSAGPRREPQGWLTLRGARGHNLAGVDFTIPLGTVTCVTGVSGSGKSSLVLETLMPALRYAVGRRSGEQPLDYDTTEGHEELDDVVHVDQAPLGRTSRGNPATYVKAWDVIRKRFARESLARERGYAPGYFSFNVEGGRCEACKGEGAETVEMQFLADVTFSCPECKGRRFVGPVLDVQHRGRSVADVLEMTVREALDVFTDDGELVARLEPLRAVGLGYLRMGQPLNTLSGGEAQRLKLAEAVGRTASGSGQAAPKKTKRTTRGRKKSASTPPAPEPSGGRTLLVLDEPTAGLHADDIAPLLEVIDRLVNAGNTVIVVEHDMQVAARADWIVDLGPGAGDEGGRLVAAGTPEQIASAPESSTAPFVAAALGLDEAPDDPGPRVHAKRRRRGAKTRGGAVPSIAIEGAREHNLRDVDLDVPREKLVVVTGPSGSGKSTIAFDVLYAEGQRRYLETLSPYARQYMPQLPRPAVDRVAGVPPSVSLEQRTTRGGTQSTVATITEVAHYLRLLWARAGLLHCVACGTPIAPRPPHALVEDLRAGIGKRTSVTVLAPLVRGRKGFHTEILDRAYKDGLTEARIDGRYRDLEPGMRLARYKEHDVDAVVGRARANESRLEDLVTEALRRGEGTARALTDEQEILLSSQRACPSCGRGYPELDPRFFSFNTRQGACEVCEGEGVEWRVVGRGDDAYETAFPCDECGGTRLSPLARAVTVDGRTITDVLDLDVSAARRELPNIQLEGREATIAEVPLAEAQRRLAFLDEVGLGYLGLSRAADTLSGGEMQRVRLAAQLGSGLTGVLYVLDEPTIGLHPRDTGRLLGALRQLVDKGNSVLVVEHDADTIRAADHVIDVGPGGGRNGGHVVAQGPPDKLLRSRKSVTGRALARAAPVPDARRPCGAGNPWLVVEGASEHNLRDVTLHVPQGRLVTVTGVSGSGKSTLVRDVLLRATRGALGLVTDTPAGAHRRVRGAKHLKRAVEVDQSPIGRTPRSVPATYVGVWNEIRKLLAATPEARARGWGPSRFSFNVAQGRCPACEGQGALTVEMSFLPEVLVPCEACNGARFNPETLQARFHGYNAGDILDLHVVDAAELFSAVPKVRRALSLMDDLGLGYLKLGQASNTLSGGEAQRLKLVSEMAAVESGPTLYVLDEPTTGLHRDDVERLVGVLHRLVDRGDTVVVIEHQPDVMLAADWIVDLGPEGGADGGRIVAEGPPEAIMDEPSSHTGAVLRRAG